ncbi:PREDICTED: opsin-3 [Charadrius vociferus]|uniref:opsin-3 n=1 Tax=Charadrius vociferus TaxID=50402 RepID=UPI00052152FD|nr:PREDICTED: opsin-3 [Charadrius vociferus]
MRHPHRRCVAFGAINKLHQGTLDPIIQIPYEAIKQHWAQYRSLEDPACDRLSALLVDEGDISHLPFFWDVPQSPRLLKDYGERPGIVSIMTLTVLAYERYIRVVHAKVINFSWSWRAIAYIWLYSLAWTGAPLLGWNRYTLEIHGLGCSVDWKSKDPNDISFVLLFFLGCLVAPVGIMAYCYGHILYAVRMLRCVEDFQTVQVIKLLKYEKKVAKMCFLMISTFLICWMPYAVVSLLETYGYSNLVTPTVAIIPSFFAKSSTAYNPVIYIFMSRKFRQCLLQLLCFRLMRFQRSVKETPATGNNKPIRPIVMSQKARDRPKKKVTFSSSSIIFIITSDDTQQIDDNSKHNETKVNVIQVKPL